MQLEKIRVVARWLWTRHQSQQIKHVILGGAAKACSACYTCVLRSQLLMGKGDGEARQPSNLALTFHLRNKNAGLDQQLWRNKLPGLGGKSSQPIWPMHKAGAIFIPLQLEQMLQLKGNTQWLLVTDKY